MINLPRWLRWGASGLVLVLAAWLLWRELQGLSEAALRSAWQSTPAWALAASLAATAASFACLAEYERLAANWLLPGRIPRATAWRVGLLSHAIANTTGFHVLVAPVIRYREYRVFGLGMADVARIVAVVAGCIVVGVVAICLLALAWLQARLEGAAALLAVLVLTLLIVGLVRRRARAELRDSPVLPHAARLTLLGGMEMVTAIAALYVLLPLAAMPDPATFALLYAGAMMLGVVSHSPGGLGVFEAGMLAGAPQGQHAATLVALLIYRIVYGLLPFAIALLALALRQRRRVQLEGE